MTQLRTVPGRATHTERLSRARRAMLDVVRQAARRPTIHGLVEVDITESRFRMEMTDARPTMTSLVVATLARALRECPEVNVRRAGRHTVCFEPVDVMVTVECAVDGERILVPFVVEDADCKTLAEITAELKADRITKFERAADANGHSMLSALPPVVRRVGTAILGRSPRVAARLGPPIGVASVGIFGVGWGIPVSSLTLLVTIGGITTKPVLAEERCFVNHEFLPLTLTFDHTSIDGALAGRFADRLRGLLESGAVIDQEELDEHLGRDEIDDCGPHWRLGSRTPAHPWSTEVLTAST